MLIALKQEQPLSVQKELLGGGKEHLSKRHDRNCSHQLKETDSRDAIEGAQTDTQTNAGDRLLEQAQLLRMDCVMAITIKVRQWSHDALCSRF